MRKLSGATLDLVVGTVLLALLDSTRADDKPVAVKQRAVAVSEADAEWAKKGEGKLTEADLIARLGPADELKSPGKIPADYAMVWRDRTMIRVKFEKGKAVEYSGSFNARLPHEQVSPESFKKLKLGLSGDEVEEILGRSAPSTKDYQYWGSNRTLTLYVKGGKVTSYYSWHQNSADGWE